ncbi:DUF4230 domain-containing protein [Abyssalbus ytuae]|uniref:DUF4230 domain-containing protein n=1 Tax=Abyssalbus ytuae TaxID=2926907 RepID=A0A9E6ZMI6_9FLAO|nr:DUF4230 domain-containing protein [Abyssalbus ytuae]UOB18557.1 DUF4230 domain-containing protein [Abyssalbus ytuae]
MRKILFGVILTLACILIFNYFFEKKSERQQLKESSTLIREQINNVGKLIVTEGHFAEVYKYEDVKEVLGNLIKAEKSALVVINADVDIAYNLREIHYEIDSLNKVLTIKNIPDPEIKISPDLEYYDVKQDYLNLFEAEDYNLIKEGVKKMLLNKIETTSLKTNAQNRLLSELSKFFILTNSLGWTLQYNEIPINNISELEVIKN